MIFSIGNHIELIKRGIKTQTRRRSDKYRVGKLYSIQPSRTSKGIPEGKIRIIEKRLELRQDKINAHDSLAEGEYFPEDFEKLYSTLYPTWKVRYAYTFEYVPMDIIKY